MVKCLLAFALFPKALAFADALQAKAFALIADVNSNASATWRAGSNEVVFGHFHRLLGTVVSRDHAFVPDRTVQAAMPIPSEFDARTAWPDCSVIASVRNQGECGSCWAFAAIEAFEDRWCIATGQDVLMSPENLISCDDSAHSIDPSDGCEGGTLLSAWMFLENIGAVSELCQPYDLPTCPPEEQPCMDFKPTPPCREQCYGSGSLQRYQATSLTQPKGIEHTQQEIMTNGPIEVAFTVYDDFEHYKSGVYHHVTGSKAGGHAVKLIGWGEESGVPYWLATNSWTEHWGDNGLFKIKRGTNECGIENPGLAAQAKRPEFLV